MPDANDLSVLQKYIDQCSNWGRWGADDELGAVNLITEAKVREGVSLVKYGKSIPLTMAYDNHGPQRGAASLGGRNNPTLYQTMTGPGYLMGEQDFLPPHHKCSGHGVGFYDDILMMPTQSGTQWDALCHAFWDGKMYNGRSASEAGGGRPAKRSAPLHRQDRHARRICRLSGVQRRSYARSRICHIRRRLREIFGGKKLEAPPRRCVVGAHGFHGGATGKLGRLRRRPFPGTVAAYGTLDSRERHRGHCDRHMGSGSPPQRDRLLSAFARSCPCSYRHRVWRDVRLRRALGRLQIRRSVRVLVRRVASAPHRGFRWSGFGIGHKVETR